MIYIKLEIKMQEKFYLEKEKVSIKPLTIARVIKVW